MSISRKPSADLKSAISGTPGGDFRQLEMPQAFGNPDRLIGGLFNCPGVGIAICDTRLRYKVINEALALMNGIPSAEHLGKTLHEMLGQFAARLEPAMESVFQTGRPVSNFEVAGKLRMRAERGHWIENYFPIRDARGKVNRIGIVVTEISRLQRLPLCDVPGKGPSSEAVQSQFSLDTLRRLNPMLEGYVPELFHGLDDLTIDRILKAARRCTRVRGEVFCRQGQRATHLYTLTEGLVKAGGTTDAGKEVLVDWMQPGESFGLSALLSSPAENLWTIYCAADSAALQWDTATIGSFARSCPKFYENALTLALRWARQLQERFEGLSTKRVEQRLADLVLFLAGRFRTSGLTEVRISDEELAQMAGTNLFTVNKLVHSWQRLGYVNKSRRRLLIVDSAGLLRISRAPD